jgi:hypothetical protein
MTPFWSGFALGIMIGIPIFLLCVFAGLLLAVYRAIDEGIRTGAFARAWREGGEPRTRGRRGARQYDLAWDGASLGDSLFRI